MRQPKSSLDSASAARFRNASHAATRYLVEGLERRLFLSSAIAAFGTQQTFGAGSGPQSLAVADFNGDGKPDMVVANFGSAEVSVMLGNGNGTFQSRQTFATGTSPYSVAVADVNGDGKLDLVVANNGSANVSVLLGNGNGTFQAQQTFATGNGPHSVAIADLNGDGRLDLVVANKTSNNVSVLLGNGNGTFQAQQTFAAGTGTAAVAIADVNADGKPDLLVVNQTANTAGVLLGNGNGTFQPQLPYPLGAAGPVSIAVSDVNADGKPDLIIANHTAGTLGVLLGNGNGTFQEQQSFPVGTGPFFVAVSDVNGDGKPDAIVANYQSGNVSVLLGNGDGTFQPQTTFAASTKPTAVAVADVNGDGRADLLVANYGANNVSVLLGDVPPVVLSINRANPVGPIVSNTTSVSYTVMFNESVIGVDATDFSLALSGVTASPTVVVTPISGSVYTVTANGISGTGTLGLNLVDDGSVRDAAGNPLQPGGAAAFAPQQTFATGGLSFFTAVGDLNGDGKPDLVSVNFIDNVVSVLLGNGDGTFQAPQTFATGIAPDSVAIADVNGDGRPDLVVANSYKGSVSVLLGNGNGTFQSQRTFATGYLTFSVHVADVNGDGRPDIVVANFADTRGVVQNDDGNVGVLLGNGDGTFQAEQTFATSTAPVGLAIVDVNGDGRPDLVVANNGGDNVSVLLGNGDGTFQAQRTFSVGSHPYAVAVADVNGDGRPDLVVANNGGDNVSVLLGNGNGTFQPQQTFATGSVSFSYSVAVADVNGDGKPDLVVTNSRGASVLLGNGNGTFQAFQMFAIGYSIGNSPISAAVADLNGDGREDVVVAYKAASLSVLLGNSNGNFSGQTYTIVPILDTITGTTGVDQIALSQDPDEQHIDWSLNGVPGGQMAINDSNGLTINGDGSNDVVALDYSNGDPLPNIIHLDGTFTLSGLPTTGNPLADTTIDLEKSTLFVHYVPSANDPLSLIQGYLKTGYNNGTWTGTSANGSILSSSAAANVNQTTAIGYVDSEDGLIAGQPAYTIELKYTLYGDTGLAGTVSFTDFMRMTQHFTQNSGATWADGDFNYDGSVNAADFNLLKPNYGQTLPAQSFAPTLSPPAPPARPPRTVIVPPPANALVGSATSSPPTGATSLTINVSSGNATTTTAGDNTHKKKATKGTKPKPISVKTVAKNKRKSGK